MGSQVPTDDHGRKRWRCAQMSARRLGRRVENAFRVRMTGCLTRRRRLARGPKALSAAPRYATGWGGESPTGPCLVERAGRLEQPDAERAGRSAAAEGTPAARAAPLHTRGRTPRVAAQARRPFPRSQTGAVETATACVASVWAGSVVQYVRGYERRRREHAGQQETAVCAS